MRAVGQIGNLHATGAHDADQNGVGLEGTPRVDDLILPTISLNARERFNNLVERTEAAGAGHDVLGVHAQLLGEGGAQGSRERVGVAVHRIEFGQHTRHRGHGTQRVLVGGKLVPSQALDGSGRFACGVARQGVEDGADRDVGMCS